MVKTIIGKLCTSLKKVLASFSVVGLNSVHKIFNCDFDFDKIFQIKRTFKPYLKTRFSSMGMLTLPQD
jgi:hypothetical protein